MTSRLPLNRKTKNESWSILLKRPSVKALVNRFAGKRLLLVGDMVADHYLYGRTSRISREAPVLILKHHDEYVVPGQAANTACNIASLGGEVTALGVLGRDYMGEKLRNAMRERRVETNHLVLDASSATLKKTRILAGGHHTARQQVIRIDDDERLQLSPKVLREVAKRIRELSVDADALVVSDYGYGLIAAEIWAEILQAATRRKLPLVLDSRHQLCTLQGATLITPNEEEALECVGLTPENDYEIDNVGLRLLEMSRVQAVLVTRGNEGMVLFQPNREPMHIPIYGSDEVTDVTGAGDTVVASLSLALAAGANYAEAARLANVAAGLVVMKTGTATVSAEELVATGAEL